MSRAVVIGVLLAGLVLISGCQLRAQDRPVPVPEVSGLVRTTASAEPPRTRSVKVFLIKQERLVIVTRTVEPGADRLTSSLRALVRTVDAKERAQDLASAVPADTPAPAWRIESSGLQVELPGTFDGLNTSDQVLAMAQVVFTVTENSDTDRVTFVRAGRPVNVPDASGRLLVRPVTRQDYGRFAG